MRVVKLVSELLKAHFFKMIQALKKALLKILKINLFRRIIKVLQNILVSDLLRAHFLKIIQVLKKALLNILKINLFQRIIKVLRNILVKARKKIVGELKKQYYIYKIYIVYWLEKVEMVEWLETLNYVYILFLLFIVQEIIYGLILISQRVIQFCLIFISRKVIQHSSKISIDQLLLLDDSIDKLVAFFNRAELSAREVLDILIMREILAYDRVELKYLQLLNIMEKLYNHLCGFFWVFLLNFVVFVTTILTIIVFIKLRIFSVEIGAYPFYQTEVYPFYLKILGEFIYLFTRYPIFWVCLKLIDSLWRISLEFYELPISILILPFLYALYVASVFFFPILPPWR